MIKTCRTCPLEQKDGKLERGNLNQFRSFSSNCEIKWNKTQRVCLCSGTRIFFLTFAHRFFLLMCWYTKSYNGFTQLSTFFLILLVTTSIYLLWSNKTADNFVSEATSSSLNCIIISSSSTAESAATKSINQQVLFHFLHQL